MKNELLNTLRMVEMIGKGGEFTADYLMGQLECSRASLNRYVQEARHMGAKVASVKVGKYSVYRVENWEAVSKRVGVWIELEEKRDLAGEECR
jgi:biotin operon repressor